MPLKEWITDPQNQILAAIVGGIFVIIAAIITVAGNNQGDATPIPPTQVVIQNPTDIPGKVMAQITMGINVRSGPGMEFPIVGALAADSQVEVLAVSPTGDWYKISYYDSEGWVIASGAALSGDVTTLPVDNGPAFATSAPTDTPTLTPSDTPTQTPDPTSLTQPATQMETLQTRDLTTTAETGPATTPPSNTESDISSLTSTTSEEITSLSLTYTANNLFIYARTSQGESLALGDLEITGVMQDGRPMSIRIGDVYDYQIINEIVEPTCFILRMQNVQTTLVGAPDGCDANNSKYSFPIPVLNTPWVSAINNAPLAIITIRLGNQEQRCELTTVCDLSLSITITTPVSMLLSPTPVARSLETPTATITPSLTDEPTSTDTWTPTNEPTVTLTETLTPTNTWTFTPTQTNTQISTYTPTLTLTNTPTPTSIAVDPLLVAVERARNFSGDNDDWEPFVWDFDGVEMVLVPVGCFTMGSTSQQIDMAVFHCEINSEACDRGWFIDEYPPGKVCFDSPFWVERLKTPGNTTWYTAHDTCIQRNARLLTEPEWEYAARGPDSWVYPWGNDWDLNKLNDESWIGISNMVGFGREWVSTLYAKYPYTPYYEGDTLPDAVFITRVLRGSNGPTGNWRSTTRASTRPHFLGGGFRCARDA